MSEKVKVSVIIAVYNGEKYLRKCLDDVLSQTLREIEVICVDDGSADGTAAILAEYEKKDPRVRAVHQENAGAGTARNNGLSCARGEYLSFLDADDFFEPQMLERAYERAAASRADIAVFRGDRYDDTRETYIPMDYSVKTRMLPEKNPFAYRDIPDDIFMVFVGWAWDKLYRREFVTGDAYLRFQALRTSNDLFFVFSALVKAQSILVVDEKLVHHRIRVKGSLSVTREKSWDCFYRATLALREELVRIGVYAEVEKGFLNWALHFGFWNLDTIEGPGFEKVYNLLCGECCGELGWFEKERDYYKGNLALYDRLKDMRGKTCMEYLLSGYRESTAKLRETESRLRDAQRENRELRESTIFKTGSVVTALPRKVKRMLKGE